MPKHTGSMKTVAAIAIASAAGAAATWTVLPPRGGLPANLALGMPQSAALSAARRADPAAFIGQVCNGGLGVVAYIRHLGMEWMLMAHSFDGIVREVVLNRNAPADEAGWVSCERAFETRVLPHHQGRHRGAAWSPRTGGASDGTRWMRAAARLSDGTPLRIEARRNERLIAQCTFDIVYGVPPPGFRAASGPGSRAPEKK